MIAPPPVYPDVTGDWEFLVEFATPPSAPPNLPIALLSGSLSSSGGKVTGTLRSTGFAFPPCVGLSTDLAATGTISTSGDLTLNIPVAGGMATITGSLQNLKTPGLSGTFVVAGGTCSQPSMNLVALQFPNLSGTYTGVLVPVTPPAAGAASSGNVSAVLVEAAEPNADGQYPLTGTITATGACSGSFAFSQGIVYGGQVQSFPSTSITPPDGASFVGFATPIPTITLIGLQFPGCASFFSGGVLTRQ